MAMLLDGAFWVALAQIMLINVVLSGDNAVVIALACRNLAAKHRRPAIVAGSAGAIVLLIVFCVSVAWLLQIPYFTLAGSLLLFWIAIKLVTEGDEDGDDDVAAKHSVWGAIRTIIVADLVMSLDNAIAIAAAAEHSGQGDPVRIWTLITLGLTVTVPVIIVGATLIMRVMQRYPIVVLAGGALLGFVAGEMMVSDGALHHWIANLAASWFTPAGAPGSAVYAARLESTMDRIDVGAGALGATIVIFAGRVVLARATRRRAVDLAARASAPDLAAVPGESKE